MADNTDETLGSRFNSYLKLFLAISVLIFAVGLSLFCTKAPMEEERLCSLTTKEFLALLPTPSSAQSVLKYWSVCLDEWNPNGNLRSMDRVFEKLGYEFVNATETGAWDILWSIEYVERDDAIFKPVLKLLQHQRINHFPGIYYITNKKNLGIFTRSPYLFETFVFPGDEERFSRYSVANPDAVYVEKNYDNRGVRIVKVDEFDKTDRDKVYQRFMDKPFLIDGHAFDFGVYVLISSVNPLRIYRYDHDVFIRFCPKQYHPFDARNRRKYVVDEDHKCAFEMPSFKSPFSDYKFKAKSIFELIIEERGYDVREFWLSVDDALTDIISKNEQFIVEDIRDEGYNATHHFFDLVRFDLILDEDLNPYAMEVNLSPNLTPTQDKYEPYALLYEQLIYNTVNLIGGGSYDILMSRFNNDTISVNTNNIATNIAECLRNRCSANCENPNCTLCIPCISTEIQFHMRESYLEHVRKGNFKRIFPGANHYHNDDLSDTLSENNKVMMRWFESKCESDESWC